MASSSTDSSKPTPRKRVTKTTRKESEANPETRVLSAALQPLNLYEMTATAAYYRAEGRHFEPGHELEDWLTAEQQVAERSVADQ